MSTWTRLSQTLGDHVDTAHSYRKLSQLLLRRRLAEAAVMFSEAAVDVLKRIGAPTVEAEQDLARARSRLGRDPMLAKAPAFAEDSSKIILEVSQMFEWGVITH